MIKEFVGDTTLHGLRHVFQSPTKIRRILWFILLLASTVAYVVVVEQSFAKYYSDPVSTEFMEFVPEDGLLKFPAVTICNLNRFVKTKINSQENDANFYKLGLNLSVCEVMREVQTGLSCGQALLCAVEQFGVALVDNCSEITKQRLVSVLNKTNGPFYNPEEFMKAYGHDVKAMFHFYCRFAKKEHCTSDDFLPSFSRKGLCFTFNSGKNDTKVRHTSLAGSYGGLSVILDVEATESAISDFSLGLRVILHEQGSFISLDSGFNVLPGSHVLVSMVARLQHRLPPPYRTACTQRSLPLIANYTKDGCFAQCRANKTISTCGCRPAGVPALPLDMPVCTLQQSYCLDQRLGTFNPSGCSCGVACTKTDYFSQVSYSEFPDVAISRILKYYAGYNKSVEYQRKNLVFLQVGFKHLGYESSKQTPSYRLGDLFGDIGGSMGLFLGCSILTLFEFVELAWCFVQTRVNKDVDRSREGEEGNA